MPELDEDDFADYFYFLPEIIVFRKFYYDGKVKEIARNIVKKYAFAKRYEKTHGILGVEKAIEAYFTKWPKKVEKKNNVVDMEGSMADPDGSWKTIKESKYFGSVNQIVDKWQDHFLGEQFESEEKILDVLDGFIKNENRFGSKIENLWDTSDQFRREVNKKILGLYQKASASGKEWLVMKRPHQQDSDKVSAVMSAQSKIKENGDMIKEYSGMGKFNSALDELLYSAVLEGWASEETGDVSEQGVHYDFIKFWDTIDDWVPQLHTNFKEQFEQLTEEEVAELENSKAAIIEENDQGFIAVELFDSKEKAEEKWAEIELSLTGEDDDQLAGVEEDNEDDLMGEQRKFDWNKTTEEYGKAKSVIDKLGDSNEDFDMWFREIKASLEDYQGQTNERITEEDVKNSVKGMLPVDKKHLTKKLIEELWAVFESSYEDEDEMEMMGESITKEVIIHGGGNEDFEETVFNMSTQQLMNLRDKLEHQLEISDTHMSLEPKKEDALEAAKMHDSTESKLLVIEDELNRRDMSLDEGAIGVGFGQASTCPCKKCDDEEDEEEKDLKESKILVLKRDGKEIFRSKNESEIYDKLHDLHSGSWDHALKYEGYSIDEEEDLEEQIGGRHKVLGGVIEGSWAYSHLGKPIQITNKNEVKKILAGSDVKFIEMDQDGNVFASISDADYAKLMKKRYQEIPVGGHYFFACDVLDLEEGIVKERFSDVSGIDDIRIEDELDPRSVGDYLPEDELDDEFLIRGSDRDPLDDDTFDDDGGEEEL